MYTKTWNNDTYTFDKSGHVHSLNGETLLGVTTCLKVINPVTFDDEGNVSSKTDMLMAWAAKIDVQAMADRATEYAAATTTKAKESIIKECKAAHRAARDGAGAHGSNVHDILDKIISGEKVEIPADVKSQVDYAIDFLQGYDVVRNEAHVWSKLYRFGGIFDLLLKKDGKHYIADFKTSKSVHVEMMVQCAAYHLAIDELMPGTFDIAGYIVIHIPISGKCGIYTNDDYKMEMVDAKNCFLNALQIYRHTYKWSKK
jgi:hypothetical protein